MKKKLFPLLRVLVRLFFSLLALHVAAMIFIPLAANSRGYSAVGGEWIIILAAAGLTWYISGLPRAQKRRKVKNCKVS